MLQATGEKAGRGSHRPDVQARRQSRPDWQAWAIGVVAVLILFNQWQIIQVSGALSAQTPASGIAGSIATTDGALQDAIKAVIPTGVPERYGAELGISFDDPVGGMAILNQFDDLTGGSRGSKRITLSEPLQKRYVSIGSMIACEFCCGAQTLVSRDGKPACGCAHSGAMRGLAKYLLQNYGDQYTDEQILEELTKWKALFFPKQMIQKYLQQGGKGDLASLNQIPDQIGGC